MRGLSIRYDVLWITLQRLAILLLGGQLFRLISRLTLEQTLRRKKQDPDPGMVEGKKDPGGRQKRDTTRPCGFTPQN